MYMLLTTCFDCRAENGFKFRPVCEKYLKVNQEHLKHVFQG